VDKLEEKIKKILERLEPEKRGIVTEIVIKKIKNKEHLHGHFLNLEQK
jgi:hypothetical protein